MPKFVVERELRTWIEEDGGANLEAYFELGEEGDRGLYVMLHSWDDLREHRDWNLLKKKRIRITVETVD